MWGYGHLPGSGSAFPASNCEIFFLATVLHMQSGSNKSTPLVGTGKEINEDPEAKCLVGARHKTLKSLGQMTSRWKMSGYLFFFSSCFSRQVLL